MFAIDAIAGAAAAHVAWLSSLPPEQRTAIIKAMAEAEEAKPVQENDSGQTFLFGLLIGWILG